MFVNEMKEMVNCDDCFLTEIGTVVRLEVSSEDKYSKLAAVEYKRENKKPMEVRRYYDFKNWSELKEYFKITEYIGDFSTNKRFNRIFILIDMMKK